MATVTSCVSVERLDDDVAKTPVHTPFLSKSKPGNREKSAGSDATTTNGGSEEKRKWFEDPLPTLPTEKRAGSVDAAEKGADAAPSCANRTPRSTPLAPGPVDPFRPSCALPYDVPERLARAADAMSRVCRAHTTYVYKPRYVVRGT